MLVDNARSHSTCDIFNQKDENIKVMFLPPNVTSIQPVDEGVIECLKLYRKDLLLFTFQLNKEGVIEQYKKLNSKTAFTWWQMRGATLKIKH